MALNYLSVVLDLDDGQGNPEIKGTAALVPSAVLTDAGVAVIGQDPVPAVFHAGGAPSVRLLATDSTGPLPGGWTWGITFTGQAAPPAAFSFALPANPMTFTATNATPCVFTSSGTAYLNGTGVQLSGGSVPAGFTAGVTYYVVSASGSTFQLAASAGGAALASTSTGSGSVIAVQQYLSNLIPVSSGTAFQAYMPLPSGAPSSGQVPLATGSGEASAWGNVATNPMTTSGDTVYGGSGGALARLAGDTSNARKFLRGQSSAGTAQPPAWDTLQAADVPTLNQNTTGTASNITATLDQVPAPAAAVSLNSKKITNLANGSAAQDAAAFGQIPAALPPSGSAGGDLGSTYPNPTVTATHLASALPVAQGGTSAATQQAAINALTGTQSSGTYLRSDGANATLHAIVAGDVPTLNQNTSGTAAGLSATLALGSGGTGQTSAAAAYNALSPMTTTGDIEYESGAATASRLAGPTSSTKNYLTSTGTGSAAQAPAWGTIAAADLPTGTTSTKGALQLDGTAADIAGTGPQAAGAIGKAADAGHVHFSSGMYLCTPAQYAPGSRASPNTASGTFSAVDSTNITTGSFAAPASGKVLITATLIAAVGSGTGRCAFSVAAHGTVSPVLANAAVPAMTANLTQMGMQFLVTGLTPATSYNLDLLYASLDGATLTVYALGTTATAPSTSGGPVTMTVQAV